MGPGDRHRFRRTTLPVAVAAILAVAATPAAAQGPAPRCDDIDGFHRLDFWLGSWTVEVDGERAGTNRIEKVLDGCAVTEAWRGEGGGEGRSLFFYNPVTDSWKQVWVTERATSPGGLKEKTLVETLGDGSLRFQGTIPLPDGGSILDRTTLTPLSGGRVRQVIEISRDGGATWQATFNGLYTPAG
jgi:hypothetical protein